MSAAYKAMRDKYRLFPRSFVTFYKLLETQRTHKCETGVLGLLIEAFKIREMRFSADRSDVSEGLQYCGHRVGQECL